jgi:anaerobic ribonucleoside-triphosphate reductase activating protein
MLNQTIRVYGNVVLSLADGPGERAVVHFAGCAIGCVGCFNAYTHPENGPGVRALTAQELAVEILAISRSVTISGGEPTDQIFGLSGLLKALREQDCDDIVLFTGRRIEWLRKRYALWSVIEDLARVDVVIDGPFVQGLIETGEVMRGSSNQRILCLTNRWTEEDFWNRETYIEISGDQIVMTGFPTGELFDLGLKTL